MRGGVMNPRNNFSKDTPNSQQSKPKIVTAAFIHNDSSTDANLNTAKNYCSQADTSFKQGNFDEAIVSYTNAIRLYSNLANLYVSREHVYNMQGKHDAA